AAIDQYGSQPLTIRRGAVSAEAGRTTPSPAIAMQRTTVARTTFRFTAANARRSLATGLTRSRLIARIQAVPPASVVDRMTPRHRTASPRASRPTAPAEWKTGDLRCRVWLVTAGSAMGHYRVGHPA